MSFLRLLWDALGEVLQAALGMERRVTSLPSLRLPLLAGQSVSVTYAGETIASGDYVLLSDSVCAALARQADLYFVYNRPGRPRVETGALRDSLRYDRYPAWRCAYCGSWHPFSVYRCESCGAPRAHV